MSYEKDIERMEEITQKLKSDETPLKEAIALFEEGVTLAKRVEKELTEVERKVEILLGDDEESLAPFGEENNE